MKNEKRLIDANALKSEMLEENPCIYLGPFGLCVCSPKTAGELVFKREDVLQAIDSAPTVDAVEVVRCKDCKYSACNPIKLTYACNHPKGLRGFLNEGYYFCSYGEREVMTK